MTWMCVHENFLKKLQFLCMIHFYLCATPTHVIMVIYDRVLFQAHDKTKLHGLYNDDKTISYKTSRVNPFIFP